jgi:hypothetical protein
MNTWLKISNGVVINVVKQDATPPDDELGAWVIQTHPMQGPGWFYDESGVLRRPLDQPWFLITKSAFISRFTTAEWSALVAAADGNQGVKDSFSWLDGVDKVALPSPLARQAIEAFVNSGCVARERAAELIVPARAGEEAETAIPTAGGEEP